MRANFGSLSLVPDGLVAESVSIVGETMVVTARGKVGEACCPLCGEVSRRVHSRYVRHVRDLPISGRGVRLCLATRRFSCERRDCPRRIFAERFEEAVSPARARRTSRLEHIVHHLGLALGGRPAASFAKRLM
jgi:transposase